jgi:hypothetical protein
LDDPTAFLEVLEKAKASLALPKTFTSLDYMFLPLSPFIIGDNVPGRETRG